MRKTCIAEIERHAETDSSIYLLTADLGYSILESFANRFPSQYTNVGVAEQNMTGIAAGLGLSGKKVFTYSIANFAVFRCLEQIRNDVCYHNLPVTIISVGAGFAYGAQGYSHHGIEDIAVLRSLPNMTIYTPSDPIETALCVRLALKNKEPSYLRLGKSREEILHNKPLEFFADEEIGKSAIKILDWNLSERKEFIGKKITVFTHGSIATIAIDIGKKIGAKVFTLPTLVPFDQKTLHKSLDESDFVLSVEEHKIGGLASIISEEITLYDLNAKTNRKSSRERDRNEIRERNRDRENNKENEKDKERALFLPFYIKEDCCHIAGDQNHLREIHGLSERKIIDVLYSYIQ